MDTATFRTYANLEGRWTRPDPYDGSYDASNPQSFNRYAYVLNNPLSYTDPSGLDYGYDCGDNCVGVVGTDGPNPCDAFPQFCGGPGGPGGGGYGGGITYSGGGVAGALPPYLGPPHLARLSNFNNSIGDSLFSPQGGAYFSAANTAVQNATTGTAILFGGAFFGPGAFSATLGYVAQSIGSAQATALGTSGIVLGAYGEVSGYVQEAAARGLNAFNLPNLYSVLNATGNGWTANQAFLDAGIKSGQTFFLSSAPYLTGGVGYTSELLYLASRGITPVPLP